MTELSLLEYVGYLLRAAEYIKTQEKCGFSSTARQQDEHGYACTTAPLPARHHTMTAVKSSRRHRRSARRSSFTSLSSGRSTHNELEKNRRAQLRSCFERLKEVVPSPSGRHTTQGLLINAQQLIKSLEQKMRLSAEAKSELEDSQRRLRKRLALLTAGSYRSDRQASRSPTSSESAASTSSSYSPAPSDYETIDVIGSGSSGSDVSSDVDSLDCIDIPPQLVPYTSKLVLVDRL